MFKPTKELLSQRYLSVKASCAQVADYKISCNLFYRFEGTNFYLSLTNANATGNDNEIFHKPDFQLFELSEDGNGLLYNFPHNKEVFKADSAPDAPESSTEFAAQFYGEKGGKSEFIQQGIVAATRQYLALMVEAKTIDESEAIKVLTDKFGAQAAALPLVEATPAPSPEAKK